MTTFEILWLTIAIVFTAIEFYAIFITKRLKNTFSYQMWVLSHYTWFRMILFGSDGWVTWHFLVQPYLPVDTTRSIWPDLTIILVMMIVGVRVGPPKWRAKKHLR
jgi:hypothetical protein